MGENVSPALWAWTHYSTYKLLWIPMNPNREIRIMAYRAIIERVVLLYSGILLFRALKGKMAISTYYMACGLGNIVSHIN